MGRATAETGVQMIPAYSLQVQPVVITACFGTCQNRLPQELPLTGFQHT